MTKTPSEFVSTFLESVGKKQHVELYLRIFRELPKSSFAVIASEPALLRHATGTVVEGLRFLSELDLRVTLAMGLLGDSGPTASSVLQRLRASDVPCVTASASEQEFAELGATLETRGNALVDLRELPRPERADRLAELLAALGTRKLVVLRSRGGLGPHEAGYLPLSDRHRLLTHDSGISVINLKTDLEPLLTGHHLGRGEADLLRVIAKLHGAFPSLLTSITSPFHLIQELFTVKGMGTLVKTGSTIHSRAGLDGLEIPRIGQLIEDTFGKSLRAELSRLGPVHVHLEQRYRGVAIVQAGRGADYLSKFAVSHVAQGEGIGRDLWEAVTAQHDALYWRADPKNPIAEWYARECDGMQRTRDWTVFWRGVDADRIPSLIEDARARPNDFQPNTEGTV